MITIFRFGLIPEISTYARYEKSLNTNKMPIKEAKIYIFDCCKVCSSKKKHSAKLERLLNYSQLYVAEEDHVVYFYRQSRISSPKSIKRKSYRKLKGKDPKKFSTNLFKGNCKVTRQKGRGRITYKHEVGQSRQLI